MLLSAMCTQPVNKLGNITGQLQQGRKHNRFVASKVENVICNLQPLAVLNGIFYLR